ncbi:MAG: SnoaL-like domain-containing protein [Pseudomonadota bacterium]
MFGQKDRTNQLAELDRELNAMILNGEALAAFEKFYADDVVMQENDAEPTVGKDANRIREQEFFDAVTDFRGAEVLSEAIGGNTTFSHWRYDYTHRDWGVRDYHQVAVRTWKDGKVIREVFYYG